MNTNITPATAAAYLAAKARFAAAKAEVDRLQAEILGGMGDTLKMTVDGYNLSATRGKTKKFLSAELIEKKFNIILTDDCYSVSRPWDELRVTAPKA